MRAADGACVGELEDALGARVERSMNRMAEPRSLAAGGVDRARHVVGDLRRRLTGEHPRLRLLEQQRARLGGAEDDGAAAEDACRDGALQRSRIGVERHARGDVGRHHPVLGDRDQQEIEEVALVVGGLLPGEQQMEVLREAEPAHQVAAEIAAPHLDPVGVGLADVADRVSGLPDLHATRWYPASLHRHGMEA